MTSLLDIGDLTEEVEVRGVKLTVRGLTAGHVFQLFSEFPDMRKAFDGKTLLNLGPELLAKIIAMGLGHPRDKDIEARAMSMGAGDQIVIIAAMQRLTFPDGIGPFVEQITKLMTSVSTPSLSRFSSNSTTRSPAASSALLQMDTPGMMPGRAHRAN
jgi:hypothetical protein